MFWFLKVSTSLHLNFNLKNRVFLFLGVNDCRQVNVVHDMQPDHGC
jgi:hypothetical protein